jgi:hypothetical protein
MSRTKSRIDHGCPAARRPGCAAARLRGCPALMMPNSKRPLALLSGVEKNRKAANVVPRPIPRCGGVR